MKIRETIAFVGDTDEYAEKLTGRLAEKGYSLVLVNKPGENTGFLADRLLRDYPQAEVDVVTCEREGCWESDIILVSGAKQPDQQLIEKMKAVTVQKIFVRLLPKDITAGYKQESALLEKELPYTKLVWAFLHGTDHEMELTGDDPEGLYKIKTIFSDMGYKVHCPVLYDPV